MRGVNPPTLGIYFSSYISDLLRKAQARGLDKILGGGPDFQGGGIGLEVMGISSQLPVLGSQRFYGLVVISPMLATVSPFFMEGTPQI